MFHYIYRHVRPDKDQVFYVGRGKMDTRRCESKQGRNNLWKEIIKLNNGLYDVEILLDELTLQEAIEKEQEFIGLYRRIVDGGTLCNISSGGGSGTTGIKHSKDTRGKMSASHSKRQKSNTELEHSIEQLRKINTGRIYTEELRGKLASKGFKGRNHAEETKLKLSSKLKGRSKAPNSGRVPKPCIAENIVTMEIVQFRSYAEAEKYTLVNHNHIRELIKVIGKQSKNWTFRNIE